ncbi:MAG TPA: hypothetical protein VNY10_13170 [Roseiarcus sp.]|nr:hypothetical protein [Roseiarcus sp.]
MAAAAALVVLLGLFDAATFREAALVGLLAAADPCVIDLPLGLVRFRFASFVAAFFALARTVLLVLRATRVFDAVLLLLARFRTLDEDAALVARFAFVFAVEAAPVFFVFELVVFLDLVRATIVNLSTRKLFRTRYRSAHEYYPKSVLECYSRNGEVTFRPGKPLASSPGTLSDFRSTINWSFSTNPSKNQRGR